MTTYLNPPFDKRMLTIGPPSLGSKQLKRGRMVVASGVQKNHGVHFLYNPLEVQVSHSVDPSGVLLPSANQPKVETPTTVGQLVNIGGVSLDLLYDRTYELWDKSQAHTKAGKYGVYADVMAFYRCLGIVKTKTTKTGGGRGGSSDPVIKDVSWDLYPVKAIDPSQLYWFYIGTTLRFYGVLTEFSVTYSHWNHKMVPTRCAVSMTMQFQPEPPGGKKAKVHSKGVDKTGGGQKKHHKPKGAQPNPTKNKPHVLPGGN